MKNYILFNNPILKKNKLQVQLDIMKQNKEKLDYYQTFSNYVNICDWMIFNDKNTILQIDMFLK